MTQRIQGDHFGRPACLVAFAVSVEVLSRPSPDQLAAPSRVSLAALDTR